jgi:spore coat protein A
MPTAPLRELILFEGEDEYGRLVRQLGTAADGPLMWDDPTTENPFLDDVEVWSIINMTEDAHPIHLHLVRFQILTRQKFRSFEPGETHGLKLIGRPMQPEPNERGWKDTALMFPGEVTKVVAKFDRPGGYVWHCHILSHEDHEMMRRFEVQASPGKVSLQPLETDTKVPPTALARGTIPFALPAGPATIRVYNIQGRLVRQLEAGGDFERVLLWDGRGEGNRTLPNGTYFYRLEAAGGLRTGKVVLLK